MWIAAAGPAKIARTRVPSDNVGCDVRLGVI